MENKKDKLVKKIVLRGILAFLLLVIILVFIGYNYVKKGLEPVNLENDEIVEVEIPTGASRKEIASILDEKKLINNRDIFEYYVRYSGNNNFQAGPYLLTTEFSVQELVDILNTGKSPIEDEFKGKLVIPEGINIEDISKRIIESTKFSEEEFMTLIDDNEFIGEMENEFPELLNSAIQSEADLRYVFEGYLFPATYEVDYATSLENLVYQMLSKTNSVLSKYYEDIKETELNVHEVLTLASYIEREGYTTADRKLISGVFHNRIEENMPLQTDLSVLYALGEHKEYVSLEDLKVDSPYNTYKYKGLGAGPINSPSEDAINAAIYPDETSYMYFLADLETGEIYFAETYDKHLEYKEKYLDNK